MARFDILSTGGAVRYTGAPTYNGVFGKASYLEFQQIASPTPIDWEVGDYIDYPRTGLRYKLYSIPQPERHARTGASGESIVYRNVQFFAATKDLEVCPFNDLVMGDNLIHYSSQPDVNTYENVRGIADRIQANLDAFYGVGVWRIDLYDADSDVAAIMDEAKEFSVSDGNCMDALDAIYNTWKGIGWIHTYENGVNVITIGRPNVQDANNSTDLFTYGRGNGLTVLATSLSGQNELATRIYPFGSTRNMISRYYNAQSNIKDHESVYIPNLMLPITSWGQTEGLYDPRLAYIENATAVAKYGLRVKRIYFDGEGEYEEIYPSISGATAKNIRDAKTAISDTDHVPSPAFYPDSERMDVLKSVIDPITDNGIMGEDGKKYIETVEGTASEGYTDHTGMVSRMGETIRSTPFGVANLTGNGKLTVRSNFVQMISLPKTSSPTVEYRIEVYRNNSLIQKKDVAAEILGSTNNYVFRLNFPDISFSLTDGGQLSVVVVASVMASAGTQYTDYAPSETITYELQKSFADSFTVKLKQIGFDISKQQSSVSDGLCTLNMKSGNCAGRNFVVKSVTYDSTDDSWITVCYRQEDSSLGQYFPNSNYPVLAGDQFVLTDLEMPEIYINIASARLQDAATALLAKLSTPKIIYEPEIDAKVIAEYGDVLKEGMYMSVGDSELIGSAPIYILIDTLTIYENESNIPTYKVSLRDERYENTISKLTGEISRLNAQRRASLYDEARSRYLNDTAGQEVGDPVVNIIFDGNTFSYVDADTVNPQTLLFAANVVNIPAPSYQWQYLSGSSWVNIADADESQLVVTPENDEYFDDVTVLTANIRCVVTYNGTSYYSDSVTVSKIMGGVGTPGEDAWAFLLTPPALQVPTDSGYNVVATALPTSQAALYKGSTQVSGVSYSLDSDSVIYFNGDTYVYSGDAQEEHEGGIYDSEYENNNGDIILLEQNMHTIWDGSSVQEDFTLLNLNQGLSIDADGLITVLSNIHFTRDCLTRLVGVTAVATVDGVQKTFRATLSVSAQVAGSPGTPGTPGTPGGNGYTNIRIPIYQRSASGRPAVPSQNVTYNVSTGQITYGSISPWSLTVPSGSDPCYVSFYVITSNSSGTSYTLFSSMWTTPTILVEAPLMVFADRSSVGVQCTSSGEIVVPTESISIQCRMKRGDTEVSPTWYLDDGMTITVGEGSSAYTMPYAGLNPNEETSAQYPYWWYDPETENEVVTPVRYPSVGSNCLDVSDNVVEITSVYRPIVGLTINSSGLISGTPTYMGVDSVVLRAVGEYGIASAYTEIAIEKVKNGARGLAGKVMRGVSEFTSSPSDPYQGMDDTDTTHIYYDVVTYNDNLYYCKVYQKVVGGVTKPAAQITPGTDADVWVPATNFKFVATDLLLAQNAYVKFLESRGIYLENGANNIVGGGQGGNGVIWWAGSSGASPDPSTAPFRVNYDGSIVASEGAIGPYTLDDEGLTRTAKPRGNASLSAVYAMRRILMSQTQQGATSSFEVSIGNTAFATIAEKIYGRIVLSLAASNAQTGVALQAFGDIRRYGLATGEYESAVTVLECTQAEYDAAVNDGNATNKTIFVITDATPRKVYLGTIQLA